ncbi:hypothetical protein [Absidia glauca]|uniref:Uncharacterized protein n=1 Tax=Absidia glauca TaxID=4829 RepID=A0A168QF12_ABSGL|nr:hypothetical protein [Absidia glauca]
MNSPSTTPFPVEVLNCSNCQCFRHPAMFVGLTRNYKTCSRCRYLQTPPKLAPSLLNMNFLSQLSIDAFFFSEGTGSRMECDIHMNDRLLALIYEEVALEVIDQVSQQTGYRHTFQDVGANKLSHSVIFRGRCINRNDIRHEVINRQRHDISMATYPCRGQITGHIDKRQSWIHLEITHATCHPIHRSRRVELDDEEITFIRDRATTSTTPSLFGEMIRNFGYHVIRAQVYYWRLNHIEGQWNGNENEFLSAQILIRNRIGFEELLWVEEDNYVAFGFKTPFFYLCAGSSGDNLVKEYHVDSTYRTVRTFISSTLAIPRLNETCGRLCIWHLKKAVDCGLAQGRALEMVYDVNEAMREFYFILPDFIPIRAPGLQLATKEQRDVIITMMGDHYCRHPIFNCLRSDLLQDEFQVIATQIHQRSANEVYMYCREDNLADAWAHLYRNWYSYSW